MEIKGENQSESEQGPVRDFSPSPMCCQGWWVSSTMPLTLHPPPRTPLDDGSAPSPDASQKSLTAGIHRNPRLLPLCDFICDPNRNLLADRPVNTHALRRTCGVTGDRHSAGTLRAPAPRRAALWSSGASLGATLASLMCHRRTFWKQRTPIQHKRWKLYPALGP